MKFGCLRQFVSWKISTGKLRLSLAVVVAVTAAAASLPATVAAAVMACQSGISFTLDLFKLNERRAEKTLCK